MTIEVAPEQPMSDMAQPDVPAVGHEPRPVGAPRSDRASHQLRWLAASRALDALDRRVAWLAALAGVGIGAAADWISGPYVSMVLLYSIAVAFATWVIGLRGGIASALGATSCGMSVRLLHPLAVGGVGAEAVNTVLRAALLGLLVWIVGEQRSTLRYLDAVSVTDPLTGALNRAGITERLRVEVAHAERHDRPLTVAYFDLDGLKRRNDQDGHGAGDQLINQFVTAATTILRSVDAVGRMGGDEFVAVLPNTAPEGARTVVERLRSAPDMPAVSIGVVSYDGAALAGVNEILRRADQAMYAAKRSRSSSVVYDVVDRDTVATADA